MARRPTNFLVIALLVLGLGMQAGAVLAADSSHDVAAKLILTGGRIYADGGEAEALAIDDQGLILAVGGAQEVDTLRRGQTQVIDLNGDVVLPGFHDMHVHPVYAGLRAQQCNFPQGAPLDVIQQRIKSCVQDARPGDWIQGGRWDASAVGRIPTRQMLDSVAPDNPVLLEATSGHSSWANSRAIEIAGLDRDTPDPEGGIIERDGEGTPAGVFRESASELIRKHVPPPTGEEMEQALAWSLEQMLAFGITSFTEAAAGYAREDGGPVPAYAALADAGTLKQRARLCLRWAPDDDDAEAMIAARNIYARDRVATDCVKILVDGVPTDSHTAAMLAPYSGKVEGRDDEASRKGMLLVDQEVLNDAVTRFDRMGLTIKFHAAGDAAVRASLDAIEAARKANGFSGTLHEVGHCTFVDPNDVDRARALGATFEVSPYLWGPTPINDSITAAVGDARMDRVWPVRDMLEADALVVAGSDWSVVPSSNPWVGIETLMTRERPGGSDDSFGKGQAITLDQALDLFTANAARHKGEAHRLGRIAPGMAADLVIIDRDPFEIPVRDLHETAVLKTIIGGEIAYER